MLLDGLYTLVNSSESEARVRLCDENHPIFKAHFPTNPILPAFTHIEIISDVFDLDISSVKKAKFSAIVSPKSELLYQKEGRKVKVFCEETLVATFSF